MTIAPDRIETKTLTLDGREVEFTPGESLYEVARRQGKEVPTLCYDDRLEAFGAWDKADCGNGTTPAINVDFFEAVTCDTQEYNQRGGNVNAVIFRDAVWPYVGAGNTLALTTVTFNLDSGEIFDADLEVNSTAEIKLTVTLDPEEINPDKVPAVLPGGRTNPKFLDVVREANIEGLVKRALRKKFPDARSRRDRRQLYGLVSGGARRETSSARHV